MEKGTMARRSKREYLASIQARYQRARRAEKTAILDEFTTVCGSHRTYALRLLHQSAPASSRPRRRVAQRPRYSEEAMGLLAQVREAAGSLCAQRLKAALPTWLRRRVQLRPLVAQQRDAMLVAIALELYRRRRGVWPASLDALVPELLPAIGPDRFDGEPLRYRLLDGKPLVYAIGWDRDDDRGQPPRNQRGRPEPRLARNTQADGDWILWPPWRDDPEDSPRRKEESSELGRSSRTLNPEPP